MGSPPSPTLGLHHPPCSYVLGQPTYWPDPSGAGASGPSKPIRAPVGGFSNKREREGEKERGEILSKVVSCEPLEKVVWRERG